MTDTNNEWIEKAYKAYKKNIPNYINPIDSFKKAIEDNLPQSISREAISKRETTEQQSENILTYEQGIERGRQIGYKEGRRDRSKETTDEKIDKIISDMGESPFAMTWETEARNMRKILKKHLQSLQDTTEEREVEIIDEMKKLKSSLDKLKSMGLSVTYNTYYSLIEELRENNIILA